MNNKKKANLVKSSNNKIQFIILFVHNFKLVCTYRYVKVNSHVLKIYVLFIRANNLILNILL